MPEPECHYVGAPTKLRMRNDKIYDEDGKEVIMKPLKDLWKKS